MSLTGGASMPMSHDEYMKQQQEKERLKLDVFLKIIEMLSQLESYERYKIIRAILAFQGE